MCALIHLAIGKVYVGRAQKLIRRQETTHRHRLVSSFYLSIAWAAAIVQIITIVIGTILVLSESPPQILQDYVLAWL
jgi:hypothetical protein